MHGEVISEKSNNQQSQNEALLSILNELATNRGLLDHPNNINDIISLLNAGADPNLQNQDGKTLLHYVAKCNDIKGISFLSNAGANLRLRDQNGNVPLQYVTNDQCLQYIEYLLNKGAELYLQDQNVKVLQQCVTDDQCRRGIELLSRAGANLRLRDQNRNVPLQYVTDDQCLQAIELLLRAGADLYLRGQNEEIPLQRIDDNGLQAIKLLLEADANLYLQDQNGNVPLQRIDDQCRQAIEQTFSSDLTKDKKNPTNGSNDVPKQPCPDEKDIDQTSSNDLGYGSCSDSDENSEEGSDCGDDDYLFLKDSLLTKLEIPPTKDEQKLIHDFCEKIGEITAQNGQECESILESIKSIVDKYLETEARLNICDGEHGETVTNLVLEEINDALSSNNLKLRDETRAHERQSDGIANQDDDNENKISGIIESITSKLLLGGGKAKKNSFSDILS